MFSPQQIKKKNTRIEMYNTLAFTDLLYGSENWTIKARDVRRDEIYEKKGDTLGQIKKKIQGIKYDRSFG